MEKVYFILSAGAVWQKSVSSCCLCRAAWQESVSWCLRWLLGKGLFSSWCWSYLAKVCFILLPALSRKSLFHPVPGAENLGKHIFHHVAGDVWQESVSSCCWRLLGKSLLYPVAGVVWHEFVSSLPALSGKCLPHPDADAALLGKSLFHRVCGTLLLVLSARVCFILMLMLCCLAKVCFILSAGAAAAIWQ